MRHGRDSGAEQKQRLARTESEAAGEKLRGRERANSCTFAIVVEFSNTNGDALQI